MCEEIINIKKIESPDLNIPKFLTIVNNYIKSSIY
jgi:hypothetical protein